MLINQIIRPRIQKMHNPSLPKKIKTLDLVDVISVEVIAPFSLKVTFEDNTVGNVTISPTWLTGIFESLKDEELFKQAFIENGAVTWPNGLDLSPDNMYREIKLRGRYDLY